jgi:hypothetical protein
MADSHWPPLPYSEWKDTCATLHMWSQVVGKIALATAPPLNHSWGIALQIGTRGLITRTLFSSTGSPATAGPDARRFTLEFDFVSHQLLLRTADGVERSLPLEPMTVADFYRRVLAMLAEIGISVRIWSMPVEIPNPIRFEQDTVHRHYDREPVERFWRILQSCDRVLSEQRCSFVGKCSPVHFFWGSFDLAVTRFSGRPAPPREGPAFMREAYSHEVISHGFWPGNDTIPEPVFYAYATPEPAGFKETRVEPAAAYYHGEMGEFLLPYEAVRTAADPDAALARFVETTYDAGSRLAEWDRATLERSSTMPRASVDNPTAPPQS